MRPAGDGAGEGSAPGTRRPKTVDDPPPWQLVVVSLLLAAVAWTLAAGRLARFGGDVHQSLTDSTCLSGASVWAIAQAVVAACGVVALVVVAGAWLRHRSHRARGVRVAGAAATGLAVAWLILMTALDPRDDLGIYGGCGLG